MKIRGLLRKLNILSVGLEKASDYFAYRDHDLECYFHDSGSYNPGFEIMEILAS